MANCKDCFKMRINPKISTISKIDKQGIQYVNVFVIEPSVNEDGLWQGGYCFEFNLNHKKQTTSVLKYWYSNGVPIIENYKPLRTWKDEILSPDECLKVSSQLYENLEVN